MTKLTMTTVTMKTLRPQKLGEQDGQDDLVVDGHDHDQDYDDDGDNVHDHGDHEYDHDHDHGDYEYAQASKAW